MRGALQSQPQAGELYDRLIAALVWLGRAPEASVEAEAKLRLVKEPGAGDFARCASLWAKTENWARATAVLHVGLKLFPEDPNLAGALKDLAAGSGPQVTELVQTLISGR